MKAHRIVTKTRLKTAAYWLLCIGLAAVSQLLQFPFARPADAASGGLSGVFRVYKVHPVFFLAGVLLGLAGFTVILHKLLRPRLEAAVENDAQRKWIVQAVFGCIGMMLSAAAVTVFAEEMTGRVFRPVPAECYCLWFPCYAFGLCLGAVKKQTHTAENAE